MQIQLMKARKFKGFSFRSILIHSLWISILGIVLFRLATANTQNIIYVEILAMAGVVLATAPWIVQLTISMAIILSHNAGVCDLTWLVKPPAMEGSCCGNSNEVNKELEEGIVNCDEQRLILKMRRNEVIRSGLGFSKQLMIEGINGPKLQRNRTV